MFLPALFRLAAREKKSFDRIGYIASGKSGWKNRPYQPCRDIGRIFAEKQGLPCTADLRKKKNTKQSQKSYSDRFLDIHDSLEAAGSILPAKSYLLIEDVFTTGATANEAARILKKSGVFSVTVWSMLHREDLDSCRVRPGDGIGYDSGYGLTGKEESGKY